MAFPPKPALNRYLIRFPGEDDHAYARFLAYVTHRRIDGEEGKHLARRYHWAFRASNHDNVVLAERERYKLTREAERHRIARRSLAAAGVATAKAREAVERVEPETMRLEDVERLQRIARAMTRHAEELVPEAQETDAGASRRGGPGSGSGDVSALTPEEADQLVALLAKVG